MKKLHLINSVIHYCDHELIHYWLHPSNNQICYKSNKINQKSVIEWQANEGSAQLWMPKDLFIKKYFELNGDIDKLSNAFFVGNQCIKYRINNLKSEIKLSNSIK